MNTALTSFAPRHISRNLAVAGFLLVWLSQSAQAAYPYTYRPAAAQAVAAADTETARIQVPPAYRPAAGSQATLTSNEALADLHLWQQATAHLSTFGLYRRSGARYEQASAEYQRLRSGEAFHAEVKRLLAEKGETVSMLDR